MLQGDKKNRLGIVCGHERSVGLARDFFVAARRRRFRELGAKRWGGSSRFSVEGWITEETLPDGKPNGINSSGMTKILEEFSTGTLPIRPDSVPSLRSILLIPNCLDKPARVSPSPPQWERSRLAGHEYRFSAGEYRRRTGASSPSFRPLSSN